MHAGPSLSPKDVLEVFVHTAARPAVRDGVATLPSRSNEALFEAHRDGDPHAFAVLDRRVRGKLVSFIAGRINHRTDAEDIAQNALARLHFSTYDPARGRVETYRTAP
jgi:hypothetical protein